MERARHALRPTIASLTAETDPAALHLVSKQAAVLRDVNFCFQAPVRGDQYLQFYIRVEDAGEGTLAYLISLVGEHESLPEAVIAAMQEALAQVKRVKNLPAIEAQRN